MKVTTNNSLLQFIKLVKSALNGKASASHSHTVASTSANGFMSSTDKSKLDGITASADAVSFTRSLTSGTKVGTITINGTGTDLYAPTNTDTHYTTGLKVGASNTATANAAATNGNVYLNALDNTTVRDSHKIVGTGATTVTSDANGVITINSTDNNTTYSAATTSAAGLMSASDKSKLDGIAKGANNYSLPAATSSTLGGVKVGSNITNSSGTISLTKANVTSALGYTPPTTNTTYGVATTSANGLMSSTDKKKLDGINSAGTFTLDGTTLNITSTSTIFSLSGTVLTITSE